MNQQKIRVAVLYGGRSGEHEVSLQSAASVVKNMDHERFEIIPIAIDKQGRWLLNDYQQLGLSPSTKALALKTEKSELLSSLGHLPAKPGQTSGNGKLCDVVFPVLHGMLCEDGTVQGMLELMDIAYVGAGVLSSALGMDKDASKRLIAAAGLKIPAYVSIKLGSWQNDAAYYQKYIEKEFGYPVFVKPCNTGSSVGVHKVNRAEDLVKAAEDAFLYDVKILIEKAIDGREIELAVLENLNYGSPALVSLPGEVVPIHEFYSYAAKYLDEKGAKLIVPAALSPEKTKEVQHLAERIFEILDCEGMARVDLFLDKNTGEFIFNEINTIPGFTQMSMYPKLWEASGLAFKNLTSHLVDLALARHERRQNLKREWAVQSDG